MTDVLNFDSIVDGLTNEKLIPIVEKILRQKVISLGKWQWTSFMGTGGGMQNSAVYRVTGICDIEGQSSVNWAVILKMIRYQDDTNTSGSHYWKREFEAYQSGWLTDLPVATIRAPMCYATDVFPEQATLLWLEDLSDADSDWNRQKLAIVARHLGQFNGHYLTQKQPPDYAWFSKNWISKDVDMAANFLPEMGKADVGTFLSRVIPQERVATCHKVYNERHDLLKALGNLPKTIQHLDAFTLNLFLSNTNNQQETIAIDWAFVGLESIGAELVSLFLVSVGFGVVTPEEIPELEQEVFANYLNGLKDSGWQGDVGQVRLGFILALGLRHFGGMCYSAHALQDEARVEEWSIYLGTPVDAVVECWLASGRYIDTLMEEGRKLINSL